MPHNAHAPVSRLAHLAQSRLVGAALVSSRPGPLLHPGGAQGLSHSHVHRVELVVARHLLRELAAVILEHDEVADQVEEPVLVEDARKQHLQLRHRRRSQSVARYRPPRLHPLAPGGERPKARFHSIRHRQQLVEGEQRGDLRLVGLQLLEGRPDRRVLVRRVLQLEERQRQTVDERRHIRAACVAVLGDGELIDGKPVVVVRVVEVKDLRLRSRNAALGVSVLHRHPVHQQAVHRAVARFQGRTVGSGQLAEGIVQGLHGQRGIQCGKGIPQPLLQDNLRIVAPLGEKLAGRNLCTALDRPAGASEPGEGGLFDGGFGHAGHDRSLSR